MPMIEIMSPLSDTWVPPSFNVVGEDSYEATMKVGVGSIKGTFDGNRYRGSFVLKQTAK